jgi:hypothetical protein
MSIVIYRSGAQPGAEFYQSNTCSFDRLLEKSIHEVEFEYYQMCGKRYSLLVKKYKTPVEKSMAYKALESKIALVSQVD